MGTQDRIIPFDELMAMAVADGLVSESDVLKDADAKIEGRKPDTATLEAIETRDRAEKKARREEARAAFRDARDADLQEHEEDCSCRGCRHLSGATSREGTLRSYGSTASGPFNEDIVVKEQVRLHPLD